MCFVAHASRSRGGFRSNTCVARAPQAMPSVHSAPERRTEIRSGIKLDAVKIIQDAPGVAHNSGGPIMTSEVVCDCPVPFASTGTDANVQIRGISPKALTTGKK